MKKNSYLLGIFFFIGLMNFSGCYSFKGISIPVEVNTFYVDNFTNRSSNIVPQLSQDFTEDFKDKIRRGTRLTYNNSKPDLEFSGAIVGYDVISVAPRPGETTALSRLTIAVAVECINNLDEEKNWNKNFSFFQDFDASANLADVQDQLNQTINTQILEDIFNFAFTDW